MAALTTSSLMFFKTMNFLNNRFSTEIRKLIKLVFIEFKIPQDYFITMMLYFNLSFMNSAFLYR